MTGLAIFALIVALIALAVGLYNGEDIKTKASVANLTLDHHENDLQTLSSRLTTTTSLAKELEMQLQTPKKPPEQAVTNASLSQTLDDIGYAILEIARQKYHQTPVISDKSPGIHYKVTAHTAQPNSTYTDAAARRETTQAEPNEALQTDAETPKTSPWTLINTRIPPTAGYRQYSP